MRSMTILAGLVLAAAGCRELPAEVRPGDMLTVRGELAAGAECPMLIVGERRFSLAGSTGAFKPGDRVCVKGTVAEMSFCMAGEATIAVEAIGAEDACP